MVHGSSVTTSVHPSSRQRRRAIAAWRMATISACAVGSRSASRRLPPRPTTVPASSRMTAPTGTSASSPVAERPAAWPSARRIAGSNEERYPEVTEFPARLGALSGAAFSPRSFLARQSRRRAPSARSWPVSRSPAERAIQAIRAVQPIRVQPIRVQPIRVIRAVQAVQRTLQGRAEPQPTRDALQDLVRVHVQVAGQRAKFHLVDAQVGEYGEVSGREDLVEVVVLGNGYVQVVEDLAGEGPVHRRGEIRKEHRNLATDNAQGDEEIISHGGQADGAGNTGLLAQGMDEAVQALREGSGQELGLPGIVFPEDDDGEIGAGYIGHRHPNGAASRTEWCQIPAGRVA